MQELDNFWAHRHSGFFFEKDHCNPFPYPTFNSPEMIRNDLNLAKRDKALETNTMKTDVVQARYSPQHGSAALRHNYSVFLSNARNHGMLLMGLVHSQVTILGTCPTWLSLCD